MSDAFLAGYRTGAMIQGFAQKTPQMRLLVPVPRALSKKLGADLLDEQIRELVGLAVTRNGKE